MAANDTIRSIELKIPSKEAKDNLVKWFEAERNSLREKGLLKSIVTATLMNQSQELSKSLKEVRSIVKEQELAKYLEPFMDYRGYHIERLVVLLAVEGFRGMLEEEEISNLRNKFLKILMGDDKCNDKYEGKCEDKCNDKCEGKSDEFDDLNSASRQYVKEKTSEIFKHSIERLSKFENLVTKNKKEKEACACYMEKLKTKVEELEKELVHTRKAIDDSLNLMNSSEKKELYTRSKLSYLTFSGREQLAYFMYGLTKCPGRYRYLVPCEIFYKYGRECTKVPTLSDLTHIEDPLVHLAWGFSGQREDDRLWLATKHFNSGICKVEVNLAYYKVNYQSILDSFGTIGDCSYDPDKYDETVLHCSNNWKVIDDTTNCRLNLSHLESPAARCHYYEHEGCEYSHEQRLTRYFGLNDRTIGYFSDSEIEKGPEPTGSKYVKTTTSMM